MIKQLKKTKKIIIYTLLCSTFFSCKVDIKNYLKDYTETAAIYNYTTSLGSDFETYLKKDKNGNLAYCIPSDKDFTITFQLRNPQKYYFVFGQVSAFESTNTVASMAVHFPDLKTIDTIKDDFIPTSYAISDEIPSDTTYYALLNQNNNSKLFEDTGIEDCYYLTLTYSKDFLNQIDMGHDISPEIKLRHPQTKVNFGDYNDLKLVCNSTPPSIFSPSVYQDETNNNYVLLFNMPSVGLLQGIHRDITTLTIQSSGDGKLNKPYSYNYKLDIAEDGTYTITEHNGNALIQADPSNKEDSAYNPNYSPCGPLFEQKGQSAYIPLNDTLSYEDIIYTLILTDNYGLQSKVDANVRSKKLSDIYVTKKDDALLNGGEELKQDEGSSYATVNFIPALRTYWFESETTKMIQNKYYIDTTETNPDGTQNIFSTAYNFAFDETQIDENTYKTTQNIDLISNEIPDNAYVKIDNDTKSQPGQNTTDEINSWKTFCENTSNCSIIYEVYQGNDDTGKSLFNSTFDCIESSGSHPIKTSDNKLNNSGNTLKNPNHYFQLELPAGDIYIRVYAHKTGFADTTTKEYRMSILRTRVYVSDEGDDENNNGSFNSTFKSITHAAKSLSRPEDKDNTIYVTTNLTENIVIPEAELIDNPSTSKDETKPLYVKICSTKKYNNSDKAYKDVFQIKAKDETSPVLTIPANSVVILEDLVLSGGDIEVGENAKLYLNNVKFTGEKLHAAPTATIILGGNTIINNEIDEAGNTQPNTTVISLEERIDENGNVTGGKVQLGSNETATPSKAYNYIKQVVLQTAKVNPSLNVILIETEDGSKTIKDAYPVIYNDLVEEDITKAYKYFKLDDTHSPGYYIGYDEEKFGSNTYGRGLVKIPAVYINEPIVGGFTVELLKKNNLQEFVTITPEIIDGIKVYKITNINTNPANLTFKVIRDEKDLTTANVLKDLKLELYLENTKIEKDHNDTTVKTPVLTLPTAYPSGIYNLVVFFTYDDIQYSEKMIIQLEEVQ